MSTNVDRALARAIQLAGGQSALARAVGYTQNAIWKAKTCGRVTAELAVKIEKATNGKVRREQLAPKIFDPKTVTPITDDEAVA
jgi:DNA-binding transcriptional regulator YdaS (Cro superfamily)